MALAFTDDQIKNISKDMLLLPFKINDPATGLIAQKVAYMASIDSMLATDNDQKVFSDLHIASSGFYHTELRKLTGNQRTSYSDADIVSAAKKENSPHFPTDPIWTPFTPKLTDKVNGLPSTATGDKTEANYISEFNALLDLLKTGFSLGVGSYLGSILGNKFTTALPITGIAAGERILFTSISSAFIAIVDAVTENVPNWEVDFTVEYGTAFTGAATLNESFSGLSDNMRSGITPLGIYTSIYNSLQTAITNKEGEWKTNVQAQKTALDSNGDIAPRKANVDAAKTNADGTLTVLTAWEALTPLIVGGKLTDSGLTNILAKATDRSAWSTTRSSQILTDLGSVTQAPDGAPSGTGLYLEIFKMIDARAAAATGSLAKYYAGLMGVGLFDKKISLANDQLTQYQNIMYSPKISADTVIGQDTFTVDSVTGLAVSDQVKVMDNESIVYTRTITQITGTSVKLNTGIPLVLTIAAMARIVKMK